MAAKQQVRISIRVDKTKAEDRYLLGLSGRERGQAIRAAVRAYLLQELGSVGPGKPDKDKRDLPTPTRVEIKAPEVQISPEVGLPEAPVPVTVPVSSDKSPVQEKKSLEDALAGGGGNKRTSRLINAF